MSSQDGARVIFENCANVQAGERVLIVTDFDTLSSARLIADIGRSTGARIEMCVMPAREVDGEEPTESVAAAMLHADVVLMPVARSLAHARATKNALGRGARVLSLTATSEELLASEAYRADFKGQRPICERVGELLTQAGQVTLTTPFGTDLRVSAEGRPGQAHSCVVDRPGQFSAAPNIEASFAPVEGSMEGVFVADASIPYLGIGRLAEPVTFTIEKGRVVEVAGGEQARRLQEIWKAQEDPNVYNIAQLAVGLNPEVKEPIGRLGCNYDEGTFGTSHIGIGTSSNLGGTVKASTHFDALMTRPTLKLDGRPLLENGRLTIS